MCSVYYTDCGNDCVDHQRVKMGPVFHLGTGIRGIFHQRVIHGLDWKLETILKREGLTNGHIFM